MDARRSDQFNIRSTYARRRARELAERTGMTATQVVEEALRVYAPPSLPDRVGRLTRKGKLLVGSTFDGRPVTHEEVQAMIDAIREGDRS